jgi:hypothetical protein
LISYEVELKGVTMFLVAATMMFVVAAKSVKMNSIPQEGYEGMKN